MLKKDERGLLSLEASISLTIFIFLMLYMYSFFVLFEARNQMAHTMLATAQSMSLDTYENNKLNGSGDASQIFSGIYHLTYPNDSSFVSYSHWDKVDDLNPNSVGTSAYLDSTVKERFIAYLADGDEAKANRILKRFNIVGGIDGLDFSQSDYSSNKLKLVVNYEIEYEFQVFGKEKLKMQQSVCSKTW